MKGNICFIIFVKQFGCKSYSFWVMYKNPWTPDFLCSELVIAFLLIPNLKLFPDLKKNLFKCCILICNGHNPLFLWNGILFCGCLTTGYSPSGIWGQHPVSRDTWQVKKCDLFHYLLKVFTGTFFNISAVKLVHRYEWNNFDLNNKYATGHKSMTCVQLLVNWL